VHDADDAESLDVPIHAEPHSMCIRNESDAEIANSANEVE
jgi:hypothetical protein